MTVSPTATEHDPHRLARETESSSAGCLTPTTPAGLPTTWAGAVGRYGAAGPKCRARIPSASSALRSAAVPRSVRAPPASSPATARFWSSAAGTSDPAKCRASICSASETVGEGASWTLPVKGGEEVDSRPDKIRLAASTSAAVGLLIHCSPLRRRCGGVLAVVPRSWCYGRLSATVHRSYRGGPGAPGAPAERCRACTLHAALRSYKF